MFCEGRTRYFGQKQLPNVLKNKGSVEGMNVESVSRESNKSRNVESESIFLESAYGYEVRQNQ